MPERSTRLSKPLYFVLLLIVAFTCSAQAPDEIHTRTEIAGRQVDIWRPSTPGPAPLVVFSHGLHGCSTQSKFLTEALAEHGYFVVAPQHADAACGNLLAWFNFGAEQFRPAAEWNESTYHDRADDIRAVLAGLHDDPQYENQIDWTRIALTGHSLGGYTALAMAGGWPSWRLAGVRAVLALSPFCAPLADNGSLGTLGVPVEYQGGSRDGFITPQVRKPDGCYDQTSSPATYVEFKGAGHFAWTDLQSRFHAAIVAYSLAFLDQQMKGSPPQSLSRDEVSDLREK